MALRTSAPTRPTALIVVALSLMGCSRPVVPAASWGGQILHTYPYLEAELPPSVFSGLEAEVDREKLFAVLMADVPGLPIEASPLAPRARE